MRESEEEEEEKEEEEEEEGKEEEGEEDDDGAGGKNTKSVKPLWKGSDFYFCFGEKRTVRLRGNTTLTTTSWYITPRQRFDRERCLADNVTVPFFILPYGFSGERA